MSRYQYARHLYVTEDMSVPFLVLDGLHCAAEGRVLSSRRSRSIDSARIARVGVRKKTPRECLEIPVPSAPLDYSFLELKTVTELLEEEPFVTNSKSKKLQEPPSTSPTSLPAQMAAGPSRTGRRKRTCTSLRISNNLLSNLDGLDRVISEVVQQPLAISWIDLSFNHLNDVHPVLTVFPHLRTLYLHANHISELQHIDKLASLPNLQTLSLYGNPIDQIKHYRLYVIATIPNLKSLDFSAVTKADRVKAALWRQSTLPRSARSSRSSYNSPPRTPS